MTAPNGTHGKKKGRFKRWGGMTLVLAAITLIVMRQIWPLVPPAALATCAVLVAILIATVIDLLYERRTR